MHNQKVKLIHYYSILLILLFNGSILFGQRTIKGVVTDGITNEPLIGANIVLKSDSRVGTVSDIDGRFLLEVPSNATFIIVSYVGYTDQEVDITNANEVVVVMKEGEILQDVVVIGYGTVKRQDATGSIQNVTSEKFNRGAITSAQELIAGKVAGVSITTDGGPGNGSKIRIRGESSLTASNDPLIVIDGIPLDNGGVSGSRNVLNIINPNDIESVTVLKDASAAAIYGNRAAGGVILITTKKGTVGSKLKVNYNANISFANNYNRVDVLDGDEYRAALTKFYEDPKDPLKKHPSLTLLGSENTDWQAQIYRQAVATDHSLGFTGAIGALPYRLSLGYTDKNGVLKTDNFNRLTTALNLSPSFLDNRLQVKVHIKTMMNKNHFADRGAIGNALSFDPTQSVKSDTTLYGGYTTWKIANGNPNILAPTNPLALLELKNDNSTVNQYIANISTDYRFKFLQDLRINLSLGHDQSKGEGTIVVPNIAAFAFDAKFGGGVNNLYSQTKKNSIIEAYLNYKKKIGSDHEIDLMGGYSWQRFFVDNYFKNSDTKGNVEKTTEGKDPAELFLVSLFSRLNYNYKETFYLTGSLRRDGTSRFAPDNRWGIFPALAASIKVLDNENNLFNNIKIRAGWGVTGQQDIGDYYAYLARYQISTPFARYQFGDEFIETYRPNAYDANIRWEKTQTYNLAVDFSVIKNKLSGSIDVYQKNTSDLLNRINVPAGTNLSNFVTSNVGNMENKGFEISLNATPVSGWDISANFTHNSPKITKLTATDDPTYKGILTGGISGGVGSNIQIHSVGFAPSSFYVRKQVYDESGKIMEGVFEDINGDGKINDDDKYRYESPNANYTIGITNNFSYKNFDFSFAGRANIGGFVYNNVQTDMGYFERMYGSTNVLWNIHQSAIDNNVNKQTNLIFSDHFVTDASFFRLDHITLGYRLPNILKGMRIYTTVQNPAVFTKYKGLDPEIGNGIDNNIYPRPRTFLGGISIDF
jgi:TonB-dependent starch-binding outer membrane protein SusC